jgi:hypothetical protein
MILVKRRFAKMNLDCKNNKRPKTKKISASKSSKEITELNKYLKEILLSNKLKSF